jgi:hypothetical protein
VSLVRVIVLSATVAVLAASSAGATASSGVRGNVVRGERPGSGITIVPFRSGVRVATTTSSDSGSYRSVLRPGTYVVRSLRTSMAGSFAGRTVQ